MDVETARRRISDRRDLGAFISVSSETGDGPVVAVKDLVDVRGMVTTAGGVILPASPAREDAPVIRRLREAGCVVVGKANLHEFAYGVTNVNPHYGPARNPHDPGRISGGSSGGSAVAVAAEMCDWAVGSDTGGSIRIPASLCGVVGFKPAFGSVDVTGVVPLSPSLDTLGPIAPDVAAAARAYSAMSGEEIAVDSPRRPKLGVPAGWVSGLDDATQRAWDVVSQGAGDVDFVSRDRLYSNGLVVLLYEAAEFHRRWALDKPEKYGADVLALIRRGFEVTRADYESALEERAELERSAYQAMDGVDAIILPATAIVAPPLDAGLEVREPLTRFTRPFNASHQPVAVIPAPVNGLPVGIQVVGKTNAETLSAAAWLEHSWK